MRMPRRAAATLALVAIAAIASACGTSLATPVPTTRVIQSAADAARTVADEVPLFEGIGPKDPNLIGQAAWYEATPDEAAKPPVPWTVTFRVGWGDCPAGCIDEHTWTYEVGVDGSVTFASEAGSAVPPAVFETLRVTSSFTGVAGRVMAGPTCPVERPGDTELCPAPGRRRGPRHHRRRWLGGPPRHHRRKRPVRRRDQARRLHAHPAAGRRPDGHGRPDAIHGDGQCPVFLDVAYDTGIR